MKPAHTKFVLKVLGFVGLVSLAMGMLWVNEPQKATIKRELKPGDTPEIERLSTRLAALERQTQQTQLQVLAIQQVPLQRVPSEAAGPEAVAAPGSEVPELSDTELILQERASVEKLFQHYEGTFQAQPRGGRWGRDMETGIDAARSGFASQLPGTRLLGAECRLSLCKASFEHGDAKEQQLLPALLQVEGLPNVSIHKETLSDGTLRSRVYLSHDAMPVVPQQDG